MATLREQLVSGNKRTAVVDEALVVLDQEVADKGGISGLAIKAAYSVVKNVGPGFLKEVVNSLLDDFVDALDPLYAEAIEKSEKPGKYLEKEKTRMANALLAITDRKAERAKSKTIQGAYAKLRPSAQKHVEAAAPRLGQLVERHVAN